ncbi:hypothetical protein YPPY98_1839, partial [Yersinia pestis PY-98]
MRAVVKT